MSTIDKLKEKLHIRNKSSAEASQFPSGSHASDGTSFRFAAGELELELGLCCGAVEWGCRALLSCDDILDEDDSVMRMCLSPWWFDGVGYGRMYANSMHSAA